MKFSQALTAGMPGWNESDGVIYGPKDGFAFCVVRHQGLGAFVTALLAGTEAVSMDTVVDFVRANKETYRLYGKPKMSEISITIELNKTFGVAKAEDVINFLPLFASFLKENGLKPGCVGCNKEGLFDFYSVEDTFLCLCDDCAAAMSEEKDEEIQLSSQGSRVSGVIGAFLGGLVGTIPWIILGLLGYVASLGGLAISFASFYGYKLLKGRLDSRAFIIVINILVVAIMTFVATILSECAVYLADVGATGYDGSLMELLRFAFRMPFDPELAAITEIWRVMGTSYFFSALGTLVFLLDLGKSLKNSQARVEKVNTDGSDPA